MAQQSEAEIRLDEARWWYELIPKCQPATRDLDVWYQMEKHWRELQAAVTSSASPVADGPAKSKDGAS